MSKNINAYYNCLKHIDTFHHVIRCPLYEIACDQFFLEFEPIGTLPSLKKQYKRPCSIVVKECGLWVKVPGSKHPSATCYLSDLGQGT